ATRTQTAEQPTPTAVAAAMAATAAPVTPTGKKTAGSTSRQAACWRHRSTSQAAHRIDSTGSSGVVALIHTGIAEPHVTGPPVGMPPGRAPGPYPAFTLSSLPARHASG